MVVRVSMHEDLELRQKLRQPKKLVEARKRDWQNIAKRLRGTCERYKIRDQTIRINVEETATRSTKATRHEGCFGDTQNPPLRRHTYVHVTHTRTNDVIANEDDDDRVPY